MSWSFTVLAKSKDGLKAESRRLLLQWHVSGSKSFGEAVKVADSLGVLIDLFLLKPDALMRLETSGHVSEGVGDMKVSLSNCCGTLVD